MKEEKKRRTTEEREITTKGREEIKENRRGKDSE